jgi:hypothetical protein
MADFCFAMSSQHRAVLNSVSTHVVDAVSVSLRIASTTQRASTAQRINTVTSVVGSQLLSNGASC